MEVQCEGALYDRASQILSNSRCTHAKQFFFKMSILDLFSILTYFKRRLESLSIPGLSLPYCTFLRLRATLIFYFRWFNFEKVVKALVAKKLYHLNMEQVQTIIQKHCFIENKDEVAIMLNFYHDLGVIVKHGNTVVLQAKWLIKLFQQLITVRCFDDMVRNNIGCISMPSYRL